MKSVLMNKDWTFSMPDGGEQKVDIPHTWNGKDGQDGGNDYRRCTCTYKKTFAAPDVEKGGKCILVFKGVNSNAKAVLNGTEICSHAGGYSTFGADITALLKDTNELVVYADNTPNDSEYPQFADFTFYGGIYRDVYLYLIPENGFVFGDLFSPPLKLDAKVDGKNGVLRAKANVSAADGYEVTIQILDGGCVVAEGKENEDIVVKNVHLWDGTDDPFLYDIRAVLTVNGKECDTYETTEGFRSFSVDPKKGFFLNGRSYPLRGVSRHQDRPDIGNAIGRAEHEEDIALIKEVGANTIRLAHYQHDDYFYELCDRAGFIIWAEVPYISKHQNNSDGNIKQQLRELISQQYNHPCICFWGISNEITMKKCDKKDMHELHRELNSIAHEMDPSRKTTLACFAMCGPFNRTATYTDVVSWNLYLGWYTPFMWLNDLWVWFYRLFHPNRCFGYSEYGAEGMPGLHSQHPKRFDNTEEYQTIYHEYMLRFFDRSKFMWATHVWNMFDFAADGRNQGGDPGKNHKGLMTFDRKLKKDAFYLYQAYWSKEPVLHLCGKRFVNRDGKTTQIKVYSNKGMPKVTCNGQDVKMKAKSGGKVFVGKINLSEKNEITAKVGSLTDSMTIKGVDKPDPAYKVTSGNSMSWEK